MKKLVLQMEATILRHFPVRHCVIAAEFMIFRAKWLWGRVRFGALVPNRGLGCVCAYDCEIKYANNLTLGDRVVIGPGVSLGAHSPIKLGNDVRISRDVIVETAGLDFSSQQPPYLHRSAPILVEDGAWIGARAIVLGGVTIGQNSVVAAGAVVTRPVESGQVVAGVPARPVGVVKKEL